MEQREPSARVDVDEIERGRMDASCNAEPAREAFDQLRLARAEFAGQTDDESAWDGSTPRFAERFGFRRAMGNHFKHAQSGGSTELRRTRDTDFPLPSEGRGI